MPKERRDRSLSATSSRVSPYPCSSGNDKHCSPNSAEEIKEWEEARCPVCMEHPHNAVLLLCSSHDKGCRPFMCDTSYRHSNCLDQFQKAFAEIPTPIPQEDASFSSTETIGPIPMTVDDTSEIESPPGQAVACECSTQQKLMCPLCRGPINGWIIVEPARRFMDAMSRSCACETCEFGGTYAELRKHARTEHPLVRPSKADPERERDWRRMERERDIGDVLSTIQSAFGEESSLEESLFSTRIPSLSVLIFFRVSRVPLSVSGGSSSWPSSPSRYRGQLRSRRRSAVAAALRTENLDSEANSEVTEGDDDSSEDVPIVRSHQQNHRRGRSPDDEP